MTDPERGFLDAIRADPEDDDLRMTFAAWLEMNGQPERAEFLRLEVTKARELYPSEHWRLTWPRNDLWREHAARWLDGFGGANVELRRDLPVLVCSTLDEVTEGCRLVDASKSGERLAEIQVCLRVNAGDEDVWPFVESPLFRRVTLLQGGSSSRIGPAAAEALAASPHAAGLRALDLANTWTGVEGAQALAQSSHLAGLRTLNLSYSRVYQLGFQALAESPHLTHLWHLNLSDNGVGIDMLAALAGSAALASVRSLQLRGGSPGSGMGVRALADVDRFPALTRLDLSSNRITDAGLAFLLRWPGLSRLTHLLLGENRITDQGAAALAGNASLSGLIALDLHQNRIRDAGAVALAGSPHLANVRWLSLVKNRNISHPTRARLKQQMGERIDIR